MKKVIWIIGSNGSGKTTQSRLLHNKFGNAPKKIIELEFDSKRPLTYITTFGRIAHVGAVRENQCTGTDTLGTRDQIEYAYYHCLLQPEIEIIVIDGIMATGQWKNIIKVVPVNTVFVLLDYGSLEANLKRLAERRAKKKKLKVEEIEFDGKTLENIDRKINNFRRLFNRMEKEFNYSFKIDADNCSNAIHKTISNAVSELISVK